MTALLALALAASVPAHAEFSPGTSTSGFTVYELLTAAGDKTGGVLVSVGAGGKTASNGQVWAGSKLYWFFGPAGQPKANAKAFCAQGSVGNGWPAGDTFQVRATDISVNDVSATNCKPGNQSYEGVLDMLHDQGDYAPDFPVAANFPGGSTSPLRSTVCDNRVYRVDYLGDGAAQNKIGYACTEAGAAGTADRFALFAVDDGTAPLPAYIKSTSDGLGLTVSVANTTTITDGNYSYERSDAYLKFTPRAGATEAWGDSSFLYGVDANGKYKVKPGLVSKDFAVN